MFSHLLLEVYMMLLRKYQCLFGCMLFLFAAFQLGASPISQAASAGPERVSFTDSAGRQVELPAQITRIAPSGALAQMFLLAIAPDMLCAVSSAYSAAEKEFVPSYFANLPVVGQFYGSRNLNSETIAGIAPDVVIDIGEPKKSIVEDMDSITAAIAIPAIHITADLHSTADAFRTLGKLLGREEKGEALAKFCDKTLVYAEEVMARVGNNKKPVLYCMGNAGLNVLPLRSFHSEVLDWMAENKAVVDNPSSSGSGNETNLEQILLWDPELILFGPGSVYATAASDPTWKQLQAISTGAYYEVPLGPYNWMGSPPSINRYLGMLWLGKILYPTDAQYDLYTEVAEYYRLFYGHELTQERFRSLTANSIR
jgi:iron complex transport system substrate-binding protein